MNPIKTLKRLNIKKVATLMGLCLRFPLFILPTVSATKKCMSVSTQNYGALHYRNGQANAFRHAFWNYFIAKKCGILSKNKTTVLLWTEKITDWHENAFPNRELSKKMDLHNNAIGRTIYLKHPEETVHHVIGILKKMAAVSIKITTHATLAHHQNKLVHITDD